MGRLLGDIEMVVTTSVMGCEWKPATMMNLCDPSHSREVIRPNQTDIIVANRKLVALVDTGASDLFMFEEAARKLGLKIENESSKIKTVNSKSVPIKRVTKGVNLQLGDWTDKVSIKVIPLDDYDFVVGLSFLDQLNAFIVLLGNYMVISDSNHQCMVKMIRKRGFEGKTLLAV
ncbi:hypothetical protein GOBAR_AA20901 [Gossypium barbadense]|uniref:Peptidase A2 domain-containing protein n=1 Tax=Gossypium barbadense TaxID=3634 RepID=A0A2P5X8X0_GOSBA|nr:hypothetical protein GOBAR_AA20901 [Gossypium barbadense]